MSSCKFRSIVSHTLVPELIPTNAIVVDAGANHGEFSSALVEEFGCRCFAIEPSPDIFQRIPSEVNLRKFCFALAGAPGEVDLHVSRNSESTTLHPSERGGALTAVRVVARTLEEFCGSMRLDRIDVLKMDIEGEELAVLNSCSDKFLKNIGQITVEFHEWIGLGTAADVKRIIGRLKMLGFFAFNISRTSYCDVLFVNRCSMSLTQYFKAWVNLLAPRFFQGIFRRLAPHMHRR